MVHPGTMVAPEKLALVSQSAEEVALKAIQCEFKSHLGHMAIEKREPEPLEPDAIYTEEEWLQKQIRDNMQRYNDMYFDELTNARIRESVLLDFFKGSEPPKKGDTVTFKIKRNKGI